MINVRLVVEIEKEGSLFTLVGLKLTATNTVEEKTVTTRKGVNQEYTNVSSLFSAIETETVALVQSNYV